MKKSNFVALVLGTVGMVFFALGICMALLQEWWMFRQGIVSGCIGLVLLLITAIAWRRMEGKEPIRLNTKTVGTGVAGPLILGIGMCLTMVFSQTIPDIAISLVAIIVLLMLIPLTKGIHD